MNVIFCRWRCEVHEVSLPVCSECRPLANISPCPECHLVRRDAVYELRRENRCIGKYNYNYPMTGKAYTSDRRNTYTDIQGV